MGEFFITIVVIIGFIAFGTTTLWINNTIFEISNPLLFTGEDGKPYVKQRNSKVMMGLIAALFWALLLFAF